MRRFFACVLILIVANGCDAPSSAVDASSSTHPGSSDSVAMRIELHFSGALRELAQAAAAGDAARVGELVEYQKLDPNALSEEGMPLLLWPVHAGNLEGFAALLKHGADVNARAGNGELLMHYVIEGASEPFVRAALKAGADANAVNRDKEPLIHIARRVQKWDVVETLLGFGADVDALEGGLHGNTVLSMATGFGDFEHAYFLLEQGADPALALKQAPKPERVGAMPMLEDIFHRPVDADVYPEAARWQQKCRDLLSARGIEAPPKPQRYQ